jgi:hypothetical protein
LGSLVVVVRKEQWKTSQRRENEQELQLIKKVV